MRAWLQRIEYRIRTWLARRWCDPQLAWLAERYGSVLVTSERHGKIILPMYHAQPYDVRAELVQRVDELIRERDFYRRQCGDIHE